MSKRRHCCGTIWPSAPTASRATRILAISTLGTSGQNACARAGQRMVAIRIDDLPAAWGGATVAEQGASQAPPQGQLHGMRIHHGGVLCRHCCQPCASIGWDCDRSRACALGGRVANNMHSRKCRLRVRDAWNCQPCGQSPSLRLPSPRRGGERARA